MGCGSEDVGAGDIGDGFMGGCRVVWAGAAVSDAGVGVV